MSRAAGKFTGVSEELPNLYTAGCDVGSIITVGHVGGLSAALTTGRIAGQAAVACARAASTAAGPYGCNRGSAAANPGRTPIRWRLRGSPIQLIG